ncbi:MAG TPA: heat-inducible transcriptional repressor HrcA, partial [Bdellovibrionota bacterium]|nr:heat-inducible transcriptional repressor HrcA [Bdellovibrionota bacterium]
ILEDHRSLRPLLLQASRTDRTQVLFSSEMVALPLPPCSLVASPVQLKDGRLGALMVLGNLRLKYEEVISLVDYTSSLLSHLGKQDLLR